MSDTEKKVEWMSLEAIKFANELNKEARKQIVGEYVSTDNIVNGVMASSRADVESSFEIITIRFSVNWTEFTVDTKTRALGVDNNQSAILTFFEEVAKSITEEIMKWVKKEVLKYKLI